MDGRRLVQGLTAGFGGYTVFLFTFLLFILLLQAVDGLDPIQPAQALYQLIQLLLIMYEHLDKALEQPFPGLDRKGGYIDLELTGDDIGDLMDNAHIIHPNDPDPGEEGDLAVLDPFGLYHTVAVVG